VADAKGTCPKCAGRMAEGFVLDRRNGVARTAAAWIVGSLEQTMFGNARLDGRKQLPLRGLRCEACGFVELYALRAAKKD